MKVLVFLLLGVLLSFQNAVAIDWDTLEPQERVLLKPYQENWDSIPERRQERLVNAANTFVDLPDEQRKRVLQQLKRMQERGLDPAEARNRIMMLMSMTERERRRLLSVMQRFNNLSDDQKARLRERFRNMTPEQRRQFMMQRQRGN